MARARLTVDEIILSVEKHLKQIARRTHSDELILQLIRSKTANQFTEEDIKNLRNKYHKILELNRLAELMDSICTIAKGDRSDIENDIVFFSGYEDPFSQTDERLKIALRMLKNYNRRVPDSIKQKAHDEIAKYWIKRPPIPVRIIPVIPVRAIPLESKQLGEPFYQLLPRINIVTLLSVDFFSIGPTRNFQLVGSM